jgi:nucleoside-diphosphate-sugar epimerase
VLIVGCGYIGRALGARYLAEGRSVTGVVRSVDSVLLLRKIGIHPVAADFDEAVAGVNLSSESLIFYMAPPPDTGTTDPRMTRFLQALETYRPPRIVYLSTTGVYGDCEGAWVDEESPVNPRTDRARRRVDAEQQLMAWRERRRGQVVILRVAGIYGPGRLPLAPLRKGLPVIAQDQAPWSNRIHADDLVAVCHAAMAKGRDGEVYNVSDGNPGTMTEYFNRVADLKKLDRPPVIGRDQAREELPARMLSYLQESRRIDVGKMLRELELELRYPTIDQGLPASV